MVKELDTGMQALSRVILSTTGKDISDIPGAGQPEEWAEVSLRS